MSGLFGVKAPNVVLPPPMPGTDAASQAKIDAASETARQASLRGRSSTILTGGNGVSDMGTVKTSSLLGG